MPKEEMVDVKRPKPVSSKKKYNRQRIKKEVKETEKEAVENPESGSN
jgi:hypothetical protein